MIYLMWSIMEEHRAAWYFLAAVCAAAGALASGTGITVLPVLVGAFGLAELVHTRSWKRMLLMWATALPSLVYLLCYVRFWDIVQVYY
jgi:Flp pilus assembly protein TadB